MTRRSRIGTLLGLGVAALMATLFTWNDFGLAFPIVEVPLEMSRTEALHAAETLALERGWGPPTARSAASFGVDRSLQTFVELEGGGREAFVGLLGREAPLSPYRWTVRRFAEGEVNETRVHFSADGRPIGFGERFSEDYVGGALDDEESAALVDDALDRWGVDRSEWELIETSQETVRSGRVDRRFVHRWTSGRISEAEVRLEVTVSGDRVSGVERFLKIPESFDRRYEEMRSANNAIATGASLAALLLYVVGGCGIGLVVLLRHRLVAWKWPIVWGVVVGGLQAAADLNRWPSWWFGYDTAVVATTFAAREVAFIIAGTVGQILLLVVTFAAAEGLGRMAFGGHVQLWRTWGPTAGSSRQVAFQTAIGVLSVPLFFAYDVALYRLTTERFGWWSPSDTLIEPDLLATPAPWLGAIARSLQAGFWEEALFRAVPLAGAALIGRRFGREGRWVVGALLLQAVVFGAAHANYATQPAWARPVELFLPSLAFGLLYLRFGLLPGVVLHALFDVVWFALPVFVARGEGSDLDRAIVVGLALLPVWVLIVRRLRSGAWSSLATPDLNRGWRPVASRASIEEVRPARVPRAALSRAGIVVVGLIGATVWAVAGRHGDDVPVLEVTRLGATAAADAALLERGVELGPEWHRSTRVVDFPGRSDLFVWETGDPSIYRSLVGPWLEPPVWRVRFARFTGELEDRAEEWRVVVAHDGVVRRVTHVVPEARPGATLPEHEALSLARSALPGAPTEADDLIVVSIEPTEEPSRRDWEVVFRPPEPVAPEIDGRLRVGIAGDEVVDSDRWIHVPESWERSARDRRAIDHILSIASLVILACLALLALIRGFTRAAGVQPDARRLFVTALAGLGVLYLAQTANEWPSLTYRFSTAQPYGLQVGIAVAGGVMMAGLLAGLVALLLGFGVGWGTDRRGRGLWFSWLEGLALATVGACVLVVPGVLTGTTAPTWPDLAPAGAVLPIVGLVSTSVSGLVVIAALALFVLGAFDRLTDGWSSRRWIGLSIAAMTGFGAVPFVGADGPIDWAVTTFALGLGIVVAGAWITRSSPAVLVTAAGAIVSVDLVTVIGTGPFPGSRTAGLVALLTVVLVGSWLAREVAGLTPRTVEAASGRPPGDSPPPLRGDEPVGMSPPSWLPEPSPDERGRPEPRPDPERSSTD